MGEDLVKFDENGDKGKKFTRNLDLQGAARRSRDVVGWPANKRFHQETHQETHQARSDKGPW